MRSRRFTIHGGGLPSLLEKSAKPVVGTEPLRGVEEETDGVKRKRRFVTPIAHDRLEAGWRLERMEWGRRRGEEEGLMIT